MYHMVGMNCIQTLSNSLKYIKTNFSFFLLYRHALEENKFVIGLETNKSLYGTYLH